MERTQNKTHCEFRITKRGIGIAELLKTTNLIIIWIFCMNAKVSFAQDKKQVYDTLGNGAVKISSHVFPAGAPLSLTPILGPKDSYTETYIVKGSKVLHENEKSLNSGQLISKVKPPFQDKSERNLGTTIHAEVLKFKYLIDWENKKVVVFGSPVPSNTAYQIDLDKMTIDYFYRAIAISRIENSLKLRNDKSAIIAGHECSTGTFVLDGKTVKFYYTKDPIGIISPLNAYVSPAKHINIMAVFYPSSGLPSEEESTILFKIEEVMVRKFEDFIFELPEKSSIIDIDSIRKIKVW